VNRIVRPSGEISASRMSRSFMMSAGMIGPPLSAPGGRSGAECDRAGMMRSAQAAIKVRFINR